MVYCRINKDQKRIYNTTVKSIIYGSEVWKMISRMENMLKATEIDYSEGGAGNQERKITNKRVMVGLPHRLVVKVKA